MPKLFAVLLALGALCLAGTGVAFADSDWRLSTKGAIGTNGSHRLPMSGNGYLDADLTDTTPADGQCAVLQVIIGRSTTNITGDCRGTVLIRHTVSGAESVSVKVCRSIGGACSATERVTI